jgi:phosphoribosylamine--glycine ligase
MKNVLVLGSGGREHAIAWKISRSSMLNQLYVAPGNPGTAAVGTNVQLDILDAEAIAEFVREHQIDCVVIGPEAPLVAGVADALRAMIPGITVVGPGSVGARLEGSKEFCKQFLIRHNIPTARYASFGADQLDKGLAFLETMKAPYVLKADGLAAGKGVIIAATLAEARQSLTEMLGGKFGAASSKVVIEEFMKGIELSVFIITDGESYKILPEAKDYKRVGDGDTGLNTGGMGAISPVPFADRNFMQKVEERIIRPTVRGLQMDGIPYMGFLFIGLMNIKGEPYVVEFNVRMGDPETEVVMLRLKSDLLDLFEGLGSGTLSECHVEMDERAAATVMLVSGGYPEAYKVEKPIAFHAAADDLCFHAGTRHENGRVLTSGGRVIAASALGRNLSEAVKAAYRKAEAIEFEGAYMRSDIGRDVMALT